MIGRRSRRNSFSEESQLTIENFGGSQDQINMIGRFERRISNTSAPPVQAFEQAIPKRSSAADARGTLQLGYDTDSGSEKQDRDDEKTGLKRQASVDNISLRNARQQHSRDNPEPELNRIKSFGGNDYEHNGKSKPATFAQLSNPTTWQQQTVHHRHEDEVGKKPKK